MFPFLISFHGSLWDEMCFYKVVCFVFDGIRISRIKMQKYNNPVMICKIFVRLTVPCSFCTYVGKSHLPAGIS